MSKFFSISFLITVGIATLLTNSRNAWACILISIPLVVGTSSLSWLLPLALFVGLILVITVYQTFSGNVQDILREIIPTKIWLEFARQGIGNLKVTRFEILFSAFDISLINPIFGIGAIAILLPFASYFSKK